LLRCSDFIASNKIAVHAKLTNFQAK